MKLMNALLYSLTLVASPLQAQLFDTQPLRGGGTWNGCDTSLVVEFSSTLTGYLTYLFEPDVVPGVTQVYSQVWSVYDGLEFEQTFDNTLQRSFPAPGDHLVCLTANALDLQTLQPCSTTTCRLEPILQDLICDSLVADFTISSIATQSISFQSLSGFAYGPLEHLWSFGDDITTSTGPTYTFNGSGPHRICLTVTGPPPVGCTATVCKWLYLGPAPVPCADLFEPGFLLLESMELGLVGVLDTSITYGMSAEVEWDFGDGSPVALGPWAIHGYAPGYYQVCSTVRTNGPLLADTCTHVLCKPVFFALVGMEEVAHRPGTARPNPTTGPVRVEQPGGWPSAITVSDTRGRVLLTFPRPGPGPADIDLTGLAPGLYLVHLAPGTAPVRVVLE